MKALVLKSDSLRIEKVREKPLQKGFARIKVLYAGLCGSDMHKFNNPTIATTDLILGHELVGQVIDINDKNMSTRSKMKVGNVVAVCPTLPCYECENCVTGSDNLCEEFHGIGRDAQGGFATHVDVPISNLCVIPKDLPIRTAVLADAIAVCLHAIDDIAGDIKGKKCLVIGDGAIGLIIAATLSLKGAGDVAILGKHENNLHLLSSQFSEIQVNVGKENSYDYIFETVGRRQLDTIHQAISYAKTRGKIIVLGVFPPDFQLAFNNRTLFLKEATLIASVAYKKKYFDLALKFLSFYPKLEFVITQEISFLEFLRGIDIMNNKSLYSPVVKLVFRFDNCE